MESESLLQCSQERDSGLRRESTKFLKDLSKSEILHHIMCYFITVTVVRVLPCNQ
jgi:hypothetical protein